MHSRLRSLVQSSTYSKNHVSGLYLGIIIFVRCTSTSHLYWPLVLVLHSAVTILRQAPICVLSFRTSTPSSALTTHDVLWTVRLVGGRESPHSSRPHQRLAEPGRAAAHGRWWELPSCVEEPLWWPTIWQRARPLHLCPSESRPPPAPPSPPLPPPPAAHIPGTRWNRSGPRRSVGLKVCELGHCLPR